jgi:hypothetical protein
MTGPADFLTVPLADGGTWTRLDRLADGRVQCCLCFGYFHLAGLHPIGDGMVEDVCLACAAAEAAGYPGKIPAPHDDEESSP